MYTLKSVAIIFNLTVWYQQNVLYPVILWPDDSSSLLHSDPHKRMGLKLISHGEVLNNEDRIYESSTKFLHLDTNGAVNFLAANLIENYFKENPTTKWWRRNKMANPILIPYESTDIVYFHLY